MPTKGPKRSEGDDVTADDSSVKRNLLRPNSLERRDEPWVKVTRKNKHGHRLLGKSGDPQITTLNVPNKSKRFSQDLFNTLVECRWRYTLLVFLLSHFLSWFLFAIVWYVMAAAHGDILEEQSTVVGTDPSAVHVPVPCLINVVDFTSAFIFSMESQTTIGYGTAYPSRDCPQAVVVLCFQSVCGMIIEAFSVGIVFSKLTRPHMRTQTILFSRHAVVAMRKGFLTLQFRVGDLRKSRLVNARMWVVLRGLPPSSYTDATPPDADEAGSDQTDLAVTFDGNNTHFSALWPTTVMHRIDADSPLYTVDPRDLLGNFFEILVYLEGTIQATGQTMQARTSYVSSEIMWGHELYPLLRYVDKHKRFEVDYNHFHETVEVETPLCSASDFSRVRRLSEMNIPYSMDGGGEEIKYTIEENA